MTLPMMNSDNVLTFPKSKGLKKLLESMQKTLDNVYIQYDEACEALEDMQASIKKLEDNYKAHLQEYASEVEEVEAYFLEYLVPDSEDEIEFESDIEF